MKYYHKNQKRTPNKDTKLQTMVDRGRLNFSNDLSFVDSRIKSQAPSDSILLLDADYEPGYWDVICQGGKESYDHSECLVFSV
jgi:hypothetical protein